MTNEEVIKILEQRAGYSYSEFIDAVNVAYHALRAQQTTLNGTYVSIEWFNKVKAELDALKAKRPARWTGASGMGANTAKETWRGIPPVFEMQRGGQDAYISQRGRQ